MQQKITDTEYRAAEQAFRDRFAAEIRASGVPVSTIARETRIDPRTIKRAVRAEAGVRADAMARVEHFLQTIKTPADDTES